MIVCAKFALSALSVHIARPSGIRVLSSSLEVPSGVMPCINLRCILRCILQYIPQTLSTLQSHLRFHPPMGPVVLSCIALSDPPPSSVLVSPLTEWQGSHMTCWTAHALTRVHTRTHMHSHVYTHTHTHRHALTHVYMYKSRELLTGKQLSTSSLAGMLLWPILPPQIPPAIVFL